MKYKELHSSQKGKINAWMFAQMHEYYVQHNQLPDTEMFQKLARIVYHKSVSPKRSFEFEDMLDHMNRKRARMEERLMAGKKPPVPMNQLPSPKEPEKKDRPACPRCGGRMRQQFRGLLHCKCGMSWMKKTGYFERTSDMNFVLKRKRVGKKVIRCPDIEYRGIKDENFLIDTCSALNMDTDTAHK